jgi:hypothetical protein
MLANAFLRAAAGSLAMAVLLRTIEYFTVTPSSSTKTAAKATVKDVRIIDPLEAHLIIKKKLRPSLKAPRRARFYLPGQPFGTGLLTTPVPFARVPPSGTASRGQSQGRAFLRSERYGPPKTPPKYTKNWKKSPSVWNMPIWEEEENLPTSPEPIVERTAKEEELP